MGINKTRKVSENDAIELVFGSKNVSDEVLADILMDCLESNGTLENPKLIDLAGRLHEDGILILSSETINHLGVKLIEKSPLPFQLNEQTPLIKLMKKGNIAKALVLDTVISRNHMILSTINSTIPFKFGNLHPSDFSIYADRFKKRLEDKYKEITLAEVRLEAEIYASKIIENIYDECLKDDNMRAFIKETIKSLHNSDLHGLNSDLHELVDYVGEDLIDEEIDLLLAAASISDAVSDKASVKSESLIQKLRNEIARILNLTKDEIKTRLFDSGREIFDLELPDFDDWYNNNQGFFEKLFHDKDVALCNAVAEEAHSYEDRTFLIIPDDKTADLLGTFVDIDSVDWGYDDEYSPCACCHTLALRTQHSHHGWQPAFLSTRDGFIHPDHLSGDDAEEFFEDYINNPQKAINCPELDLSQFGFKEIAEDYRSDWYGRCDDPEKILELAKKESKGRGEFIFVIDSTGQFSVNFSLWARKVPPKLTVVK